MGKKKWVKKNSVKNFLGKKIFSQIFFVKIFGTDIFLSKKTGMVNPRGRIMHPPTENSRVTIIVLGSC